ncbi:NADH:flavin oxidoreductase [Tenacibaculum todarodis]|uniref:NADH:flavin oxidoreductase n=1 Tax=Tenacibaculum todarodis TaxID=1850252 RepID=A0A1L3JIQ5_9FLAO|nr:NADH:flavin oxidoreductase [Tenacibaculum todarodis]APG64999.1 NADH:flavin oxidoreductase [Tenacibaculum todarodis]
MIKSNTPITFPCGAVMKNKFMLAPLTNQQSHENGQLSDDEFKWLTMRAKGNFGLVMTCASHVQEIGKGFPGQLGIFSDVLNEGHIKLSSAIKEHGSLAVIQLHHAGMRTPSELIGENPVCPSDNEKTKARALTLNEVKQLREDFINAAIRAKKCGYDGVEVHGAHGYILTQFLSSEINKRTDEYGGNLTNRARLLFEIVEGIREQCGKEFLLGVRLSPERFGMDIDEIKTVCQNLVNLNKIDFLDISLWDVFKMPHEEKYQEISLLEHFKSIDFKNVKWTVAGKISNAKDVQKVLDNDVDFVSIGTSAILHHNFPQLVIENPDFSPVEVPISKEHLKKEGLSETFITYLKRWPDFVK